MAKIFIYIFSFIAFTQVLPESISRKELTSLRQTCINLYKEENYTESIPALEKYLSYRNESKFKIMLAKSFLYRKDFLEPKEDDEIFLRQSKIRFIQDNYRKSAKIFSEVVPFLESVTPKEKSLGDLYFLWAMSEYFANNKEKAISLFKKSATLKAELKEMANYNIASLNEELGQSTESQIYFTK